MLATYRINNDLTLAFGGSMMTGQADPEKTLPGGNPNLLRGIYDNCGEKLHNLRGGTMYGGVIYKGQSYLAGNNSEQRLHRIQNYIHKNIVKTSRYFEDRQFRTRSYTYYGSYNPQYLNY